MISPVGNRYDSRIALLLRLGLSASQVSAEIGQRPAFIRWRADLLGLPALCAANGTRRHAAVLRKTAKMHRGGGGARRARYMPPASARDDGPSRLIRALRYHRSDATAPLDIEHVVACLHMRGVTLDALERVGVPPVEAVAAIRKHCAPIDGHAFAHQARASHADTVAP